VLAQAARNQTQGVEETLGRKLSAFEQS
jgi:hypothetical protein